MQILRTSRAAAALVSGALGALVAPSPAQDSVSTGPGLPGDAVAPWNDAGASFGSEQSNRFVVDLDTFTTGWGTTFGIAPLSKASKIGPQFFGSLLSAQGISRTFALNVPFAPNYLDLGLQGEGVNNDPSLNAPPLTLAAPVPTGVRFGAAFSEFGTTGGGASHAGVITNVVHLDPANPGRLYVERLVGAVNGCDDSTGLAALGFGSVGNDGSVVLRADGFGATGGSCSGSGVIVNNNLFYVDAPLRNPALLNTIGSGWPAGGFDFPATIQNLAGSATAHNTPGLASVGGVPYLIGTNFASQYVAGPAGAGAVGVQAGHLAAGVADHRGNISYCEKNFAPLGSTSGVAAIIGQVAGVSNTINLWGLGATGNVTGTLALTLPAVLVDATNGATNLAGVNALDHYHSQVAFQGGNGQIALNVDHQGNLLVAAVVDQPADTGADHAEHYIAVARVSPAGAVSWTMAAYNVSSLGAKPYLDGPGGAVVGRLSDLGLVTGGAPAGPSMSAPMLDSFGNVYFFSAIENLVSGNFATALLRAVYSPASFSYELERIFTVGEVFRGQNTGLDYQIRFVAIADSNSVSSATLWSQNALSQGFGGQTHYGLPGVDPKHLGGLVLGAEIVYDWDNDGSFDKVTGVGGDPASFDQEYNVLLFVGPTDSCQLSLGVGQGPGDANLTVCGTGLGLGETSTVRLSRVSPNVPTFAVLSLPGFPNLPIAGGTVISGFGLVPGSPIVVTANGAGEVVVPLVGSAVPNSLLLQFLAVDFTQPPLGPGLPGLEFSNAVLLRFGN